MTISLQGTPVNEIFPVILGIRQTCDRGCVGNDRRLRGGRVHIMNPCLLSVVTLLLEPGSWQTYRRDGNLSRIRNDCQLLPLSSLTSGIARCSQWRPASVARNTADGRVPTRAGSSACSLLSGQSWGEGMWCKARALPDPLPGKKGNKAHRQRNAVRTGDQSIRCAVWQRGTVWSSLLGRQSL